MLPVRLAPLVRGLCDPLERLPGKNAPKSGDHPSPTILFLFAPALIDVLNGRLYFQPLQGHARLNRAFAERLLEKVIPGFKPRASN
jgi:hypothetical protein